MLKTVSPQSSTSGTYVNLTVTGTANIATANVANFVSANVQITGGNVSANLSGSTNVPMGNAIGTLGVTHGGTGVTSATTGDLLYASGTNTWSSLADVATGNVVISGGVGAVPSWGKVGLTTHVTGTLPVANGGTGVTTSTGSGNVVLSTSPSLTTPVLGTPASGNLSQCTNIPVANAVGTLAVANGGTGVTASTGSGNVVLSTSPTLTTPALGTPASGNLANCTSIPMANASGTLGYAHGGTNVTSIPIFSAYNNTTQTISPSTLTTIAFNATEFDSASTFNTSTYAYTPNVNGYYEFSACVVLNSGSTACVLVLLKNGSLFKYIGGGLSTGSYNSMGGSVIVAANGSTDYFQIAIYEWTGTGVNTTAGSSNCWFAGSLIRGV